MEGRTRSTRNNLLILEAGTGTMLEVDNSLRRSGRKRPIIPSPSKSPGKVRKMRGGGSLRGGREVEGMLEPPEISSRSWSQGGGGGRRHGKPLGLINKVVGRRTGKVEITGATGMAEARRSRADGPIKRGLSSDDTSGLRIGRRCVSSFGCRSISPETPRSSVSPKLLPLEGDLEVNAQVTGSATSLSTKKRRRGRGGFRGSRSSRERGSQRGSMASRDTRENNRPPAGKKSSSDAKEEVGKKESMTTSPLVQDFQDDPPSNADVIKSPNPKHVVVDEEPSASCENPRKTSPESKDPEMSKLTPTTDEAERAAAAVKDKSAELLRLSLQSCASWNINNNKVRMEERSCAFDLQTGSLHYQKDKLQVLPEKATKMGRFPVAILPGQFIDSYKTYSPNELNYLPLSTVRYGPIIENWTPEPDSSSFPEDDPNCITLKDKCGRVLYRGLPGLTKVGTDGKCKSCKGTCSKNRNGNSEVLLHCSRCGAINHPTCLGLTADMLPFVTTYRWECTDCKNCVRCNDPRDDDKMLFCDCCDRGYHVYCVGLRKVPKSRWHCNACAVCYSCGETRPSPENPMAEWHHQFRKDEKGSKFYLHSFCVPCHKLFQSGQFCSKCSKVHSKLDVIKNCWSTGNV